jgi:hypothetical protein
MGSTEQLNREQQGPPCLPIKLAETGQVTAVLRCHIIECAEEPRLRAHFQCVMPCVVDLERLAHG